MSFNKNSRKRRNLRQRMLNRSPHCHYCGVTLCVQTSTLDHFIPVSKGGTNERSNLVLACLPCNQAKADQMPNDSHAVRIVPGTPTRRGGTYSERTLYNQFWPDVFPQCLQFPAVDQPSQNPVTT